MSKIDSDFEENQNLRGLVEGVKYKVRGRTV